MFDAFGMAGDLVDSLHHGDRTLQRRRVGQLDVDQQIAFVLARDETGRHVREAEISQADQAAVHDQHDHGKP